MTVTTTENTTQYVGDGIETIFSFSFQALDADDMFALLDEVPEANIQTLLNPEQDVSPGGTVEFLSAPPGVGVVITLFRAVPQTQETDYQEFDPFPAKTHESALDKLTMINQQNSERIGASLRLPIGDTADVVYPSAAERAEKFSFFDEDGNITVLAGVVDTPSVLRVDIQDGSGGEDSRDLMQSEVVSGGPNFPKIGFRNINGPNGPLQLNEQGKIPFDNLNIVGISVLGPFRGDDLCDKPGDTGGECTPPDTRNPSERFPDLDPALPTDTGKFATGDLFILIFEDPEIDGTMNLFSGIGEAAPSVIGVAPRDGIIFLAGWDQNGVDLPDVEKGWYHIPKMTSVGDASQIVYDDSGNTYVLGNNVDLALSAIDAVMLGNDAYYTTEKNANRFGLPVTVTDMNAIAASGFYNAPSGTTNLPVVADFSVFHTQSSGTVACQVAVQSNGDLYRRGYDGSWQPWERLATETEVVAAQAAANAAQATANAAKPSADFLRTGDRLDITNVPVA